MTNSELSDKLAARFIKGQKLTINQMVIEYFDPKSRLAHIEGEEKLRGVLSELKTRMWKNDLVALANIGNGLYGIPTTTEEYVHAQKRYYNIVKGAMESAINLHSFGKQKKLLPPGMKMESLSLPSFTQK